LVHQVKKQTLDITDVVLSSHQINAAGRIKHGNHAELLTEFDFEQAQQFASEIEQYNQTVKI
jgi:single-stranded-DNA-specific exonuclease